MFKSVQRVTYQVADLERARQWYRTALGKEPALDAPFVVTFLVGEAVLTLVAAAITSPQSDGRVVAYWDVDDIEAAYQRLIEAGATPQAEISTSLNIRVAKVIDPFGNIIGLTDKLSEAKKQSVESQPSEAALTVAFCRALAARDERAELHGPDYLAEIFLPEDRRRALQDQASREWMIQKFVTPELYGYFIARTAYMDHIFVQALRANLPQIVFLGAGYDSRAYRFKDLIQETRIFELDSQPTQQRKKALLHQANIAIPEQLAFVSLNFKTDPMAEALKQADFDKNKRTLFIWEGVTYYLPAEAVNETLNSVKLNSPAGSTVCFDYMTQAVPSAYAGELFQFWIATEKIEAFLAERGYTIVDHLTPAAIEKQYLTRRDSFAAGKTLPFFAFVQAAVSD
jgi:methyltransferase (TIGR00027 family)